MPEMTMCRWG